MAGDNKIIGYLPLTSNTVLFVVVISSLLVIILSSSEASVLFPQTISCLSHHKCRFIFNIFGGIYNR